MPSQLPDPNQSWVHGCDNKKDLIDALAGEEKTAIETDLLMGRTFDDTTTEMDQRYPVMCHPPARESDLSMVEFLRLCSESNDGKGLKKVIKLDFKEPDVIEPTLKEVARLGITTTETGAIYLNADILVGPGQRDEDKVTIKPDFFVKACLPSIAESKAKFAFSLGYKSSCEHPDGFLREDVAAMAEIISKYELVEKNIGVVLALNARQFAKSMHNFDPILEQFPELQILCWCGKGEPELPIRMKHQISTYMHEKNHGGRIGFDVRVTESAMRSLFNQTRVGFIGGIQKFVLRK